MRPDVQVKVYTNDLTGSFGAKWFTDKNGNIFLRKTKMLRKKIDVMAKCWINGKKALPFTRFSSRIAWFNGQYFVKLDEEFNPADGFGQSTNEWNCWQNYCTSQWRHYLVPIVAHGTSEDEKGVFWVAQPKVTFLPDFKVSAYMQAKAFKKIDKLIENMGLLDVGYDYGNGWAIEVESGLPKIFDYGV